MSSYLMDSNYIDPKFPPCEEYSQNSYIPEHSPEYYGRTRESGFQHHHQELYPPPPPRPSYPERQYSCTSLQGPGNSRAHGPAQAGHHHPEKSQPLCEPAPLSGASASPSPAPPACSQPAPDHPSSAASKQPIVYPWMKKIHVSTGRQLCFLLSPSLPSSQRSPPSLAPSGPRPPFSPSPSLSRSDSGLAQLNWIYEREWVITSPINFMA